MRFSRSHSLHPRTARLTLAVVSALLSAGAWAAPNVEFNPQFLQGGAANQLDLSRFERGDEMPGTYSADINVNGILVGRRDVELREQDAGTALCLTPDLLALFGIDAARLPAPGHAVDENGQQIALRPLPEGAFCDPLDAFVPQATVRLDVAEQVLHVSVPQAYLSRDPRGWVSPELWDTGISAARIGYNINHQQMDYRGLHRQSTSATVNAALNIGGWRLHHDGYVSQASGQPLQYNAGRSYARRAIAPIGMELTLGQSSTTGDLFDGVNFRGASLSTDPRMLPDSQNGYAPVVRGVAQTNARVVIRQRDYVLYQASVPAGPFEINDLYGTAYAGDLDVEVTESDGRVQRFLVPFAAVPQLLREGQQRLSVTAGTLDDEWLRKDTGFVEATVRRGISNAFTGYGGATGTEGYGAVVLGGAINTRLGAFAGDVTFARTSLPTALPGYGRSMQGQSYRVTYSKNFDATNTNIAIAAYRYSTDGFLTLSEATRLRQDLADGLDGDAIARQRTRLDLTVNQRLGERGGSLYAAGASQTYWNLQQRRTTFSVGYANTLGAANYSISAQRSLERNLFGASAARETNSVHFNLSMPLGRASTAPRLTAGLAHSNEGRQEARAGVTGSIGEEHQGTYSASASHDRLQGSSFDGSVSYRAPNASLSAGYSQTSGSRGINLGASGGVLIHRDGVAFSQQMGDTVGLLHVPGAAGASISSSVGVKTNAKGYAVVPYLQPYRRNPVIVDPKGLPLDVELMTSAVTVVPTAGAVVKLAVATVTGRSALIEAPQADGQPLPFGLDVYSDAGEVVGVVGQASRLWVRGVDERGTLTVRLAEGRRCAIDFNLAGTTAGQVVMGQCRPPAID
jgi:outer membrane usher protein